MGKVSRFFRNVGRSLEYAFTGRYRADNGNNTIHAYGFGGKIDAKGGNDRIYLGGFKTDVYTGSGNDEVYGGSAYLYVRDTSGHLKVRGAAGYAKIYKDQSGNIDFSGAAGATNIEHRHNGNISYRGAAASNRITHHGHYGNIDFAGAGASNDIYSYAKSGTIKFRGAGASNKIRLNSGGNAKIDFVGAGASNNVGAYGHAANVHFSGGGLRNHVFNDAKYGDLYFSGAGASNDIRRRGNSGKLFFNGAGANNRVAASFADNISSNTLNFVGAGFANSVSLSGKHGQLNFVGGGASNKIKHTAEYGNLSFSGAGAHNKVERYGRSGKLYFSGVGVGNEVYASYTDNSSANELRFVGAGLGNIVKLSGKRGTLNFQGGGGANVVNHEAELGNLYFAGVGAYNQVRRTGKQGAVEFNGGGAGNNISANFSENTEGNRIEFAGMGAANIIKLTGIERRTEAYTVRENYQVRETHRTISRYITFRFWGRTYRFPVYANQTRMVTKSRTVERTRLIESNIGGGDIIFRGGGAANVLTHEAAFGNILFEGAGIGNVITLSGERGNVDFAGGGGANIITHTASHGDIAFTGVGAANIVTRLGKSGSIAMTAVGAANVLTVGLSDASANNNVVFNGGGGANVITLLGSAVRSEKSMVEEVYSETVEVIRKHNGESYTTYEVVEKTRLVERNQSQGLNTGRTDITFNGVGSYNVLTHLAAFGDVTFNGGGGANVVTLSGEVGTLAFQGVGGANVLTHSAQTGDIDFKGAGIGNLLTLTGETGNIWFKGSGGANILTSTVDHGDIEFLGAGAGNVLTRTGKTGDVSLYGGGAANVLTVNTTERGSAALYGAGIGNVVTATGGDTDAILYGAGGANIVTNASARGETDVIAVAKGNVVTHTSDGDMRAYVAGGANIVTNTGSGHSDVIALGKANMITLMDGGSDVVAVGALNVISAGKGHDRVMALGKFNVVLTSGTHAGELDEVVAVGSMSIVDSGAGLQLMSSFAQNPLDAVQDISGFVGQAMETEEPDDADPTTHALPPTIDLMAAARVQQSTLGIGDTEGLEGVSDEDLAVAEAQATDAANADSAALAEGAKQSVVAAMAAAEVDEREKATVAAEQDDDTSALERDMDAELTAQANSTAPVDQSASTSTTENGTLPDGIQSHQSDSFVWSVLGLGGQWKIGGDGVLQIIAGKLNVTFGSQGSDVMIALGRLNVVFGGDGDDWIIAGSPMGTLQTVQRLFKGNSSHNNPAFSFLNTLENSVAGKALAALNLEGERTDKAKSLASGFSGAFVSGGAGNDKLILFSQYNIALAGSGDDTVVAFGTGNLVIKESTGKLNMGLAGYANVVVHTGIGGQGAGHSSLGGLMMGRFNVAYAHDGVDVNGLVMMGEGNLVVSTGGGNVYAGMLGRANAIIAEGHGHDVVVQAGVWKRSASDNPNLVENGSFFLRTGDGNSAFGQYGDLNVAIKVGHGHMTGVSAGGQSLALQVGNGTLSYIGLALDETQRSWAVKFGDGNMNAVLLGKPRISKDRTDMASEVVRQADNNSDAISSQSQSIIGELKGLLTAQNLALQVGDGTFTGLGFGSNNMMIRVGKGNPSADVSNSQRVTDDLDALNAQNEIGGGLVNQLHNHDFSVAGFDTQMATIGVGGSNLLLDMNPNNFGEAAIDFDRDRERAKKLIFNSEDIKTNAAGATATQVIDKIRLTADNKLTLDAFMSLSFDESNIKANIVDDSSNTFMGALTAKYPYRDQNNAQSSSAENTAYDATKPKGVYVEFDPNVSGGSFVAKENGSNTKPNNGSIGGRNVLGKIGNGDFVGLAFDTTTFADTLTLLRDAGGNATKASAYEQEQINNYLHYKQGDSNLSTLDKETEDLLNKEKYSNDWVSALEDDALPGDDANGLIDESRGYYKNGKSHKLYDKARKEAQEQLKEKAVKNIQDAKNQFRPRSQGVSNRRSASESLMELGGNFITHIGHGDASMAAAGANNLMLKVGLGNDRMVAIGNKNIMLKFADEVTSQSLVETTQDVRVAVGTGNLVANIGTSDSVIVVLNPNGIQPVSDMALDLKKLLPGNVTNQTDKSGYSAPSKTFLERNFPTTAARIEDFKQMRKDGRSYIGNRLSTLLSDFKKDAADDFSVEGLKNFGRKIPFVTQVMSVGDGVKYLLDNWADANFVVGGRGSDKIVAVGEFNVVFGDNVFDVLEFDARSLVSAKMQSFSGLPFGLQNISKMFFGITGDLEIKTLNGDIGDLLGGYTPDPDNSITADPEGQLETMKRTWANNLDTSVYTNVYVPPVLGSIGGAINDVVSGIVFAARGSQETDGRPDFIEVGDVIPELENPDQALLFGALGRVAERFDLISVIDFDDLFEKEFSDEFRATMQGYNYLHGDGDVMALLGENNVAFGGLGNDIAVSLSRMNLLTMGDGNDLAIVMGDDNRVSGDDGADMIIAMGATNLVTGDNGDDLIMALGSYNRIRGDEGEDILIAAGSKNLLFGGAGVDLMIGAGDKNLFYSGNGQDLVIGVGAENYYASGGGSDIIFNLGFASITEAGTGRDYIRIGGRGNTVFGGADADTFTIDIDTSYATASGGTGNDTMITGGANNLIFGDQGNDVFVVSDVLRSGNQIVDARLGLFAPNDPFYGDETEADVIRIAAEVTGSADNIAALLNEVWFTKVNDDLKIETRATKEVSGLRVAGDVTLKDYFDTDNLNAILGPNIEVYGAPTGGNSSAFRGVLTAADISSIVGMNLIKTGDINSGFFDITAAQLSTSQTDTLNSIDMTQVSHVLTSNSSIVKGSENVTDRVLISDNSSRDSIVIGLNDLKDTIEIDGSAVAGGSDVTTIGEFLNDVSFAISKSDMDLDPDDLVITTRAATDNNGDRVETNTTIKDYFANGNEAKIVVKNDDGSIQASFIRSKIHDLINTVASLDPEQMGQSPSVQNGYFNNPKDTTFAVRAITEFV